MQSSELPATDHFLRLRDGRTLAYRLSGAADGVPVLALHGTPGSRFKFSVAGAFAARHGLKLIAVDRWGYGATDPHPNPTLAAFTADMHALLASLGVDRFAVFGISGGGPYAAAIAALLGSQVAASALVSPVGPIAGATDLARLGRFHRFAFATFPQHTWLMRKAFGAFRRNMLLRPRVAMRLVVARAPRIDRDILGDHDVHQRLSRTFQVGVALGTVGMETDMRLFSTPWNVNLEATQAPTRIWIGTRDTSVPPAAVITLSERIPSAILTEIPEAGHLWVAHHYDEVLAWIAATCAKPA